MTKYDDGRVNTEYIIDLDINGQKGFDDKEEEIIEGTIKFQVRDNFIPKSVRQLKRTLAHFIRLKYRDMYLTYGYNVRIRFPYYNLTKGEAYFIVEIATPESGY